MLILLASDLHYTLPQLDWVVRVAPSYDLVVLAGDHLDISSPVSLDAQSIVILRYLALLQVAGRVAACSGNHDLTGPDHQGEQCALWLREARAAGVPTDGDSLLVGDTLFTICPWWDGPLGSQALQARLATDAARRRRAGSGSTTGRRWAHPPAGRASAAMATPNSVAGSRCTGRTSCSPATCTSRPSSPRATGLTASATPGCSTRGGRSGRCRRTSRSTWPPVRPAGVR